MKSFEIQNVFVIFCSTADSDIKKIRHYTSATYNIA